MPSSIQNRLACVAQFIDECVQAYAAGLATNDEREAASMAGRRALKMARTQLGQRLDRQDKITMLGGPTQLGRDDRTLWVAAKCLSECGIRAESNTTFRRLMRLDEPTVANLA